MIRNLFITAFLVFALLKSAFIFSQTPLTIAPNFTALDARGNYQDLYSHLNNGKYVLLDFFYNECLVCQTHIPEVNEAFVKFGCNTQEVFFLGINFENTDGEVITFENDFSIYYPNISGVDGGGNAIVELFQIIAFPTIILIAPDKSIPKQDMWPLTAVNIVDEVMSVGIDSAVCPYLSINKTEQNQRCQFYPNPAKDKITVTNPSESSDLVLTIYDFTGRAIHKQFIKKSSKELINTNLFESGLYIFQISQSGNILYSEKVIIQ